MDRAQGDRSNRGNDIVVFFGHREIIEEGGWNWRVQGQTTDVVSCLIWRWMVYLG